MNAQLDLRFKLQERMLNKYRYAAERAYFQDLVRLRADLRNVRRCLPRALDMPLFKTRLKNKKRNKRSREAKEHENVVTTEPLNMNHLAEESDQLSEEIKLLNI
ncbi:hypothetical protein DPMN_095788 [Dreissena polymorpha]|uniref:Uncharacterized protein n=1 Tax=Dreissena polymorpha TaxID=45954 RepID=A0A9D4L844_DREPO|nr:hypothetical protein DPMN_095788 [Dreissena polymorpha]